MTLSFDGLCLCYSFVEVDCTLISRLMAVDGSTTLFGCHFMLRLQFCSFDFYIALPSDDCLMARLQFCSLDCCYIAFPSDGCLIAR